MAGGEYLQQGGPRPATTRFHRLPQHDGYLSSPAGVPSPCSRRRHSAPELRHDRVQGRPQPDSCSWGNNGVLRQLERRTCFSRHHRVPRRHGGVRDVVISERGYYSRTTLSAWNYRDGALSNLLDVRLQLEPRQRGVRRQGLPLHQRRERGRRPAAGDHQRAAPRSTTTARASARWTTTLTATRCTSRITSRRALASRCSSRTRAASRPPTPCATPARARSLWKRTEQRRRGGPWPRCRLRTSTRAALAARRGSNNSELLRGSDGDGVGSRPASSNFLIWWDADLSRELLDGNGIRQADGQGGTSRPRGVPRTTARRSSPTLSADILGDWREEGDLPLRRFHPHLHHEPGRDATGSTP